MFISSVVFKLRQFGHCLFFRKGGGERRSLICIYFSPCIFAFVSLNTGEREYLFPVCLCQSCFYCVNNWVDFTFCILLVIVNVRNDSLLSGLVRFGLIVGSLVCVLWTFSLCVSVPMTVV